MLKHFFTESQRIFGEKDLDDARKKDPIKKAIGSTTRADNDNHPLSLHFDAFTTVNLTPPRPKPMTALPTCEASRLFPPSPEP